MPRVALHGSVKFGYPGDRAGSSSQRKGPW